MYRRITFYIFLAVFLPILSFGQNMPKGPGQGQGQMQGQASPQGTISGSVFDKGNGVPIEYANVVLYKAKDSSLVNGVVTDRKGKFKLENVPFGMYIVKVQFIGYRTNTVRGIQLKPDAYVKNLGEISLEVTSTNISGVTITDKKEQMEFNLDKKVINVDKNLVVTGGTAIDIMQTIPSVQVDVEGTVSLRGSSNVTILVDGRPSAFTSLDQLPASMVERVEIVTNPSARYDPDGTSGIINIVLKKKREPGYHGLVSLNVGTGDKYMGSVNLNYRYNKINVFANYDFRFFSMRGYTDYYRESWYEDTTSYLRQTDTSGNHGNFHNVKAGIDYFIDHFNTLSISGVYHVRNFISHNLTQTNDTNYPHSYYSFYDRMVDAKNSMDGYEIALNYKKTFEQKNREWTIDASMEKHNSDNRQDMNRQDYDLTRINYLNPATYQQSQTTNDNYEGQLQTDYVHPIGKGRIETGYKYTIDYSDQDYTLKNQDSTSEWINDSSTSNRFVYNEQIHAAYLIYSNSIKKFQFQAGIRFEEAITTSDQRTTGEKFLNDKFSFFPTVHLKYGFNDIHALKLSYSRRVNRPSVRSLNPFTNYSDPENLSTGNPYLKPEYINSAEFGYDLSYKGTNITTSIFYRLTTGIISRIVTLDSNRISHSTYENLNNGSSYGVELIYAQKLFKWWKFNTSGSYFKQDISGAEVNAQTKSSYSWTAKINSTWSPMKDFDIQASFNYNSPVVTAQGGGDRFFSSGAGQGKMEENYWADFGMKKDFLKGNLSVNFRIADVFKTQKYNVNSWGDNYTTYTQRTRESRIFFIGISYKINGGIKKKRGDEMNIEMDY